MGIRRPEVHEFLCSLFIPQERPVDLNVMTDSVTLPGSNNNDAEAVPPAPTTEEIPSAYPFVQPMKSCVAFTGSNGSSD